MKNKKNNFTDDVEKTIKNFALLKGGEKILIGFSGGADSTALVFALNSIKDKYKLNLYALHINHSLRDKESDEDEEFSWHIAEKLGITFFSEKLSVKRLLSDIKNAKTGSGSFEGDLREARIQLFKKYALNLKINILALAHHRDDQIETVLFRFLRGSGVHGLAGIEPETEIADLKIIRPLIEKSKNEIIEYLQIQNIKWREDRTNIDSKITRNKIRNELIPYLEKNYNPSIRENIIRMSKIFSDIKSILLIIEEDTFNKIKKNLNPDIFYFSENEFLKNHSIVKALLLRRALQESSLSPYPPDEKIISKLIEEIEKIKRPIIYKSSKNCIVILKYGNIYFWTNELQRKTKAKEIINLFKKELISG